MKETDLQQFCSKDDTRYYIQRPFSDGDFTYATSGHILVRVARRGDAQQAEKSLFTGQRCNAILAVHDGATFGQMAPLKMPHLDRVPCDYCEGPGDASCFECDGVGDVEQDASISVQGVPFNARYIEKITALPGFEIAAANTTGPTPFRFDGGIGVIMPMKGPHSKHLGNIEDMK